jgi:hypothetical protein
METVKTSNEKAVVSEKTKKYGFIVLFFLALIGLAYALWYRRKGLAVVTVTGAAASYYGATKANKKLFVLTADTSAAGQGNPVDAFQGVKQTVQDTQYA